jgi:hypothetical protein
LPGLFADALRAELSQGDIYPENWTQGESSLVVLSNDCEIDKSPIVLVVRIVADASTSPSLLGDIKRGRVFHALYLEGNALGGWANLRTIGPTHRDPLLENIGRRAASMHEEARIAFAAKVFSFLTRTLPPETQLPLAIPPS